MLVVTSAETEATTATTPTPIGCKLLKINLLSASASLRCRSERCAFYRSYRTRQLLNSFFTSVSCLILKSSFGRYLRRASKRCAFYRAIPCRQPFCRNYFQIIVIRANLRLPTCATTVDPTGTLTPLSATRSPSRRTPPPAIWRIASEVLATSPACLSN